MKIYLTLILIYFTTSLFSQTLACDKIVCINGEEIEALISEITPHIISYKKCDNADGPKYSIERTKVFVIKYKNGTKEVINDLNNPIVKSPKPKKVKKPHNKFYKGVELHYDLMYNKKSISNNGKSSYNLYASFLMNYKLNDIVEFDGSIGGGGGSFIYIISTYNTYNFNHIKNYSYSETNLQNGGEGFLGIANLGVRVNYLNFIENKNRIINPFIKSEISIKKANKDPIISYSILTGMNINKKITISIGYKYTPMKAVITEYSKNSFSNGKIIGHSTIGFHNILGKISFEF
jgi:hypothetical protein